MTGVNDLAKKWRKNPGRNEERDDCADELEDAARQAWHSVSKPPAEEDANPDGKVMLWVPGVYDPCTCPWNDATTRMWHPVARWARIRDVVLLPPEDA